MLGILLIIYQSVDFLLVGMVRRVVMLQVVGVGRCCGGGIIWAFVWDKG